MPDRCVRGHAASGPIVLLSTGRRLVKSKKNMGGIRQFSERREKRERDLSNDRDICHILPLVRDTDFVPSIDLSNRTCIFQSQEHSRAILRTGFWTRLLIVHKKAIVSGLSSLCRAARIIDEMMRVQMGSYCPSFARTMDICFLVHTALPERHGRFPWLVESQVCLTVQTWKRESCKEHYQTPASLFLFLFIRLYITDFT